MSVDTELLDLARKHANAVRAGDYSSYKNPFPFGSQDFRCYEAVLKNLLGDAYPAHSKKTGALKTLVWKIRFALRVRKLLGLSLRAAWGTAGAWVETCRGDLSYVCPKAAAEEERDAWASSQ